MAPSGLVEPNDRGLAEPTEEGEERPALLSELTSNRPREPRLRIVHSADTPSFARPVESRPIRRPVRSSPTGDSVKCEVMLDRAIQGQIGGMLRDVFCGVAGEPVPPRFVELLEALGAQEDQR